MVMGLTASLVSAANSETDQPGRVLKVGYAEFPPLEYMDENRQAAGAFVDLTRRVAAEAGYRLEWVYLPVSRTYFYLQNGVIDLWPGLTEIPQLRGQVLESEATPYPIKLSVWSLDATEPVTRFESFNERILILISGYTYAGLRDYLEQAADIKVTYAPNHLAALYMLQRNRGHYLLDYEVPVRAVIQEYNLTGFQAQEIRTRYAAWLFSRQSPGIEQVRGDFDAAYRRLAARGEVPVSVERNYDFLLPGFPQWPVLNPVD